MKIAVSGSSGLIGSGVAASLRAVGHEVLRLVRRPVVAPAKPGEIHWQPEEGRIDVAGLEGLDAVIHLAGESLMGLWTFGKRRRIRDSRVTGTRVLCGALGALARPPRVLLAASAIGYYGSRGDEVLTETSGPGAGFLAEVCRAWEAATEPAARRGLRVVNLRLGVVLARHGGALRQMLTPFKLGLGGRLGSGRQYMSWIALEDAVRAIGFALETDALRGPVNVTAPHPVTNAELTKALARAVRRPAVLPVPARVLRVLLGEMADEMLLTSARVFPQRLQSVGFRFEHEEIDEALRSALGR